MPHAALPIYEWYVTTMGGPVFIMISAFRPIPSLPPNLASLKVYRCLGSGLSYVFIFLDDFLLPGVASGTVFYERYQCL